MSIRRGIETVFAGQPFSRAVLLLVGLLGIALTLAWPRGPLEPALRSGQASETFAVTAVCFLLLMVSLEGSFGMEDAPGEGSVALTDYVRLTPASLTRLIARRLARGVLHSSVLLLLGAPLPVAAMTVGGADVWQLLAGLFLIWASGVAAHQFGVLSFVLTGGRRPLRGLLLMTLLGGAIGGTFFLTPIASPLRALGRPLDGTGAGVGASLECGAISLAATMALAGLSLAGVNVARSRARERVREHGDGQ